MFGMLWKLDFCVVVFCMSNMIVLKIVIMGVMCGLGCVLVEKFIVDGYMVIGCGCSVNVIFDLCFLYLVF